MVLETISPGCGLWASLILGLVLLLWRKHANNIFHRILKVCSVWFLPAWPIYKKSEKCDLPSHSVTDCLLFTTRGILCLFFVSQTSPKQRSGYPFLRWPVHVRPPGGRMQQVHAEAFRGGIKVRGVHVLTLGPSFGIAGERRTLREQRGTGIGIFVFPIFFPWQEGFESFFLLSKDMIFTFKYFSARPN